MEKKAKCGDTSVESVLQHGARAHRHDFDSADPSARSPTRLCRATVDGGFHDTRSKKKKVGCKRGALGKGTWKLLSTNSQRFYDLISLLMTTMNFVLL